MIAINLIKTIFQKVIIGIDQYNIFSVIIVTVDSPLLLSILQDISKLKFPFSLTKDQIEAVKAWIDNNFRVQDRLLNTSSLSVIKPIILKLYFYMSSIFQINLI